MRRKLRNVVDFWAPINFTSFCIWWIRVMVPKRKFLFLNFRSKWCGFFTLKQIPRKALLFTKMSLPRFVHEFSVRKSFSLGYDLGLVNLFNRKIEVLYVLKYQMVKFRPKNCHSSHLSLGFLVSKWSTSPLSMWMNFSLFLGHSHWGNGLLDSDSLAGSNRFLRLLFSFSIDPV